MAFWGKVFKNSGIHDNGQQKILQKGTRKQTKKLQPPTPTPEKKKHKKTTQQQQTNNNTEPKTNRNLEG